MFEICSYILFLNFGVSFSMVFGSRDELFIEKGGGPEGGGGLRILEKGGGPEGGGGLDVIEKGGGPEGGGGLEVLEKGGPEGGGCLGILEETGTLFFDIYNFMFFFKYLYTQF